MFTWNVLTIMFKGRRPRRIIKLNIWGGEKLPCPLGVLRDTKDTRECMQIKNISNTVTFDYKYKTRFSHPTFTLLFCSQRQNTCSLFSAPVCQPLQGTSPKQLKLLLTPLTPPDSRSRRCKPLPALQLFHFKGMVIPWVCLHQQFKNTCNLCQRR